MKTAIELIAAKRQRQIEFHGWTPCHDDRHDAGEMVEAALVLAECASIQARGGTGEELRECFDEGHPYAAQDWPWINQETGEYEGLKIDDDAVENLVNAAALLAAQIDRYLRARGEGGSL